MNRRVPPNGRGRPVSRPQSRPPQRQPAQQAQVRPASRKQKRIKKDITLLILEGFGRMFAVPKNAFKRFSKTRGFRQLSLIAIAIVIFIVGIISINIATRPNAFEVYVGDENLGIVRWDRGELDPHYLELHSTTRLKSHFGTDIFLLDEIIARPVRAGRNTETISFDSMITAIEGAVDFYVYAAAINVNGSQTAILPNLSQAENLLDGIIYNHANGSTANYAFVEAVDITSIQAHKSDLQTASYALSLLTTPRQVREVYTVVFGDRLYTIAARFGMSLTSLLAVNPSIDPDDFLREGTTLIVTPSVPILSVHAID